MSCTAHNNYTLITLSNDEIYLVKVSETLNLKAFMHLVTIMTRSPVGIFSIEIVRESNSIPDTSGYKVLSFNDFANKDVENEYCANSSVE